MDKEKKKELAEFDSRWNFEKTVKTRCDVDWSMIKTTFNSIQQDQGDLYMKVSKMPSPTRWQKLKLWYRQKTDEGNLKPVTLHHSQIYHWFESLANYLDISLGEAIHKVVFQTEEIRQELDLGDEVQVEINSIDAMQTPEDSKVGKDELKEMIEDD